MKFEFRLVPFFEARKGTSAYY